MAILEGLIRILIFVILCVIVFVVAQWALAAIGILLPAIVWNGLAIILALLVVLYLVRLVVGSGFRIWPPA